MTVDIEKMQALLNTEKEAVEKELQDLGVQNPSVPEDWIPTPSEPSTGEADPNQVADRSEDWNERRGTLDALETRYNNLNRALQKISAGTYGQCELGPEEIEADRLLANPAARTCKRHLNNEADLNN